MTSIYEETQTKNKKLSIPITIYTTSGHIFKDVIVTNINLDHIIVEDKDKLSTTIYYEGIEYIE